MIKIEISVFFGLINALTFQLSSLVKKKLKVTNSGKDRLHLDRVRAGIDLKIKDFRVCSFEKLGFIDRNRFL